MKATQAILFSCLLSVPAFSGPALQFQAPTAADAKEWQVKAREKLSALLWGAAKPIAVAPKAEILRRIDVEPGGFALEELMLQTLPDKRVHVWVASPRKPLGKVGAILALHGHGGTGEEVVRGLSLYWYGRALAEMGYVVISPDIGQHELHNPRGTLMGERVWDALRCLDYLETRPDVDPARMAVAGLSLGGETTMYVAALDDRIKAACSSGWLTTVANMKNGHCPCWNFPGLEENFDFSDIFALVAPRKLVLELGEKERAPGGFPTGIGRPAFEQLRHAFAIFKQEENLQLTIHPAGHVFNGRDFWRPLRDESGLPWPWNPSPSINDETLRRGEIARRNFVRALNVVDAWWATRDPKTGLYPRRLDQPVWAPNDNAADMFPFLAITAHYLAPERLPQIFHIIDLEKKLTCRLGPLPDWYSLTNQSFTYSTPDLSRLIFNAAEYCKDGLIPMTEVMGPGAWTERMRELLDAVFEHAPFETQFGLLPANDTEVNGDLLQALVRFYCVTRDGKYLKFAERIGDAYCQEVLPGNGGLPPHRWDFNKHAAIADSLNLNDHGNELIGGLAELFTVASSHDPQKARLYQEPLVRMFHRLLDKARNEDGIWVNLVKASTGEILNRETPDTWGYAAAAMHTFGTAVGDQALLQAARQMLRSIRKNRYLDWDGADSYADSIEGGLLLLNRLPEPNAALWIEDILPLFLGKQRDNGIVEGWYGDGNYARTAMMAGLYFTQGAICQPWRSDLRLGAVQRGDTLHLSLTSERDWEGKLFFDFPRHRLHMNLPTNYARLNEFPEWFTIDESRSYDLTVDGTAKPASGKDLRAGLQLRVAPGAVSMVKIALAK